MDKDLEILRNMDLSDKSYYEINSILEDFLPQTPLMYVYYDAEKFNNFSFYRVRFNINRDQEDINIIQTYSFPLPQFCKTNGRANFKGKSVFYCSNVPMSSIVECKPKINDIGYLSFWKANVNREVKACFFMPNEMKETYFYFDKEVEKSTHIQAINLLKQEWQPQRIKCSQFISERFENELPPYPITSCTATEVLYGEYGYDFIIYPSKETDKFTLNFAFHPNFVTQFFCFEKVIRFKVKNIEDKKYELGIGQVGEIKNNNMRWRDVNEEEGQLKVPVANLIF